MIILGPWSRVSALNPGTMRRRFEDAPLLGDDRELDIPQTKLKPTLIKPSPSNPKPTSMKSNQMKSNK